MFAGILSIFENLKHGLTSSEPPIPPEQRPLLKYLCWMLHHEGVSCTACDPENCENLATRHKPMPEIRAEQNIAPEPEPRRMSDQVYEPATPCVAMGVLVKF